MPGAAESLTVCSDPAAFSVLVQEHGGACLRLARALTQNEALAQDVLQQAMLDAFRAKEGLRSTDSARGWLLTITRHTAYRTLRSEAKHAQVPLVELGIAAGWGHDDPEAAAVAAEQKAALHGALRQLSPSDREVLVLRDLEQLGGPETAQILGIGERAMKSRLHRARLRLAAALRREEALDGDA